MDVLPPQHQATYGDIDAPILVFGNTFDYSRDTGDYDSSTNRFLGGLERAEPYAEVKAMENNANLEQPKAQEAQHKAQDAETKDEDGEPEGSEPKGQDAEV